MDIFKENDIRGIYPNELNEVIAQKIGLTCARLFQRGRVIVGRDGRLSSPQLAHAVLEGLKALPPHESEIIDAGLITTPMFYFLVNHLGARGGVMITASHNPAEYNGITVVGEGAGQYSGKDIYDLYKQMS